MTPFNHAVVGCGMVAGYGHLPAVGRSKELRLVAVCERDEGRRRKACDSYGVPGFADVEAMFAAVPIDTVTLSTTLPTHCELALKIAAAGKHCYCEKPMAESAADCDRMVAAFEKAGKVLAMNFEFRLSTLFNSIRRDIQAGRIGRLMSMRFCYNWDNHWHRPHLRPRRAAFLNEGFGCLDCGVHYLDMARWLSGTEFVRLAAEGTWLEPEFRFPSHIHVVGRLAGGAMVSMEQSFAYSVNAKDALCEQGFAVVGDAGVISAERPKGRDDMIVHRHFADETIREEDGGGKPWDAAYEAFAAAVRAGTLAGSVLASGRDGAEAIRLTERVIELCRQGQKDVG
ncbi:MAG: Gfo/Idh/MocA family oxidoreductase [Phycisphaerae bacterium]|nr:Gfo/Idh/MocA family oxidoreductase [Phycisphaerae bacterium]